MQFTISRSATIRRSLVPSPRLSWSSPGPSSRHSALIPDPSRGLKALDRFLFPWHLLPHYFPMQKIEVKRIVNIHAAPVAGGLARVPRESQSGFPPS